MKIEDRIIKKSTEMYLRLGFRSVTMDDIAAEMGISKKTIYQHFRNKRAIVKGATKSLIKKISDGIEAIISKKLNPIEELLIIKKFMLKNLNDENTATFYQLQKHYPQLYKVFLTMQFNKINDWLLDNLKRGINQELYRNNLHPELICRFFIIQVKGLNELQHFEQINLEKDQIQQYHLKYHLQAICTTKGIKFLELIIKTKS